MCQCVVVIYFQVDVLQLGMQFVGLFQQVVRGSWYVFDGCLYVVQVMFYFVVDIVGGVKCFVQVSYFVYKFVVSSLVGSWEG